MLAQQKKTISYLEIFLASTLMCVNWNQSNMLPNETEKSISKEKNWDIRHTVQNDIMLILFSHFHFKIHIFAVSIKNNLNRIGIYDVERERGRGCNLNKIIKKSHLLYYNHFQCTHSRGKYCTYFMNKIKQFVDAWLIYNNSRDIMILLAFGIGNSNFHLSVEQSSKNSENIFFALNVWLDAKMWLLVAHLLTNLFIWLHNKLYT